MDKTKLKKCPFCGGIATIQTHPTIFAVQNYESRYPQKVAIQNHGHNVRCEKCGNQTAWWHYKNEAITA